MKYLHFIEMYDSESILKEKAKLLAGFKTVDTKCFHCLVAGNSQAFTIV